MVVSAVTLNTDLYPENLKDRGEAFFLVCCFKKKDTHSQRIQPLTALLQIYVGPQYELSKEYGTG